MRAKVRFEGRTWPEAMATGVTRASNPGRAVQGEAAPLLIQDKTAQDIARIVVRTCQDPAGPFRLFLKERKSPSARLILAGRSTLLARGKGAGLVRPPSHP